MPAVAGVQREVTAVATNPGSHTVGVVIPASGHERPEGHAVHEVARGVLAYVPDEHTEQVALGEVEK